MELIKLFNQLDKNDASIAGGKGASLGEMTQAGIPVPSGFVILTQTFDRFIEETNLSTEIEAILESVNHKEIHTVEHASEKIQSLIKGVLMPEDIKAEILKYFKDLDSKYVAVRSSASAEDSTSAAWAGQLDSFLNTTESDLLEKVQYCWASLFTPRAIFYRFEKGMYDTKISVAVVVQKMVNSEMSGIAFSVHPITEDRNQIIIEAGFGLGEAIVSGSVTPDSYVVEKEPRKIIDININFKNKALYRNKGGGNIWKDLNNEDAKKQVLNEEQILEFSKIILNIEKHYGFPCDIEWAYENGKFYITQSRPITTLSLEKQKDKLLAQKFIDSMHGGNSVPSINGYSLFVFGSDYNTKKYYGGVYKKELEYSFLNVRSNYKTQCFLPEDVWKGYASEVFVEFLKDSNYINKIKENFYKNFPVINELYDTYTYDYISHQSEVNLLKFIQEDFDLFWKTNAWSHFSIYFDLDLCFYLMKEIYPEVTRNDLESIWHNATDMVAESFDKAQKRDILFYFMKYGKDGNLAEHCQYFMTSYKNVIPLEKITEYLESTYGEFLKDPAKAQSELDRMDNELKEKTSEFEIWKSTLPTTLQRVAEFCQIVMQVRDQRKNHFSKGITIAWRVAELLFEKAGVDKKLIENILPLDELIKGSNYIASIKDELEKRESGYVVYLPYQGLKEISYDYLEENKNLINDYFNSHHDKGASEIKGQVGNKGIAKGLIRIIRSQDQFHLFKDDEILVTGMTRPEYVPLMRIAKAIITDEGGITCHAAIVSRELNKPCIIGTKFATYILKDGDEVEVDADNGIIRILK